MDSTTSLHELTHRLDDHKNQLVRNGCDAIASLEKVAHELQMGELAKQLGMVNDQFRADKFHLMVVGRFTRGKSTFLNALVGAAAPDASSVKHNDGPIQVDTFPSQTKLTRISFSPSPFVRAWSYDGVPTEWSTQYYRRQPYLESTVEEAQAWRSIREIEVGYPARLLQFVTLLDSPGIDAVPCELNATREALRYCDAAVVLYRHEPFAGEAERCWVMENVIDSGVRPITVVNLWENRPVCDRLRSFVWTKLVHEMLGGEVFSGQDLASQDIYFINVKQAWEAKLSRDPRLYEESGMAQFERRLADFLVKDRFDAHALRFLRAAEHHATEIEEQVSLRRYALVAASRQNPGGMSQGTIEHMNHAEAQIRECRKQLANLLARLQSADGGHCAAIVRGGE